MRLSSMMIILLPIIFLACGSIGELQVAQGETYYVDATGGNDSNTGTSANNAWKTISKVNTSSFTPGDSILFKRGETWREQLMVRNSGSEGNPITIGAYGNGIDPIFTGADVSVKTGTGNTQWTASAHGTNEYYINIAYGPPGFSKPQKIFWAADKIELIKGTLGSLINHQWNWGDNDNLGYSTIYIRDDSRSPSTIEIPQRDGVVIVTTNYVMFDHVIAEMSNGNTEGFLITGGHVILQDVTSRYNYRSGVKYTSNAASNGLITRGYYYGNGSSGIDITAGVDSKEIKGIVIDGANCYNNIKSYGSDGYGIKLTWANSNIVKNCTVYNNDLSWIDLDGNSAAGSSSNLVEKNTIYSNKGSGVEIENHSNNNTVRYNYIHSNTSESAYSAGIFISEKSDNNDVYYNIVNGQDNVYYSGHCIVLFNSPSGTRIYNNTLIGKYGSEKGIVFDSGISGTDALIKNNIYMGSQVALYIDTPLMPSGLISDYNDLYRTGNYVLVQWTGDGFHSYTMTEWRSAQNQDAHSISIEPLFVDAANNKFNLFYTSPCINAGVNISLTTDFAGNPILFGSLPDIGAYEYQGTP